MPSIPRVSEDDCIEGANIRISREEEIHIFINDDYCGTVDFLRLNSKTDLFFPPRQTTKELDNVSLYEVEHMDGAGLVAYIHDVEDPSRFRTMDEFFEEMEQRPVIPTPVNILKNAAREFRQRI